jgi:hypothetical protein
MGVLLTIGAAMISFSAVFVKLPVWGHSRHVFIGLFAGGVILAAVTVLRKERVWQGIRPLLFAGMCGTRMREGRRRKC